MLRISLVLAVAALLAACGDSDPKPSTPVASTSAAISSDGLPGRCTDASAPDLRSRRYHRRRWQSWHLLPRSEDRRRRGMGRARSHLSQSRPDCPLAIQLHCGRYLVGRRQARLHVLQGSRCLPRALRRRHGRRLVLARHDHRTAHPHTHIQRRFLTISPDGKDPVRGYGIRRCAGRRHLTPSSVASSRYPPARTARIPT